jgi:type II secretory pathway pseudopilin PulG
MPLRTAAGSRGGMTMFELLVVVSVVMILAGFFFFSIHHLVVRTKLSRVQEEHKVLTRALQNYQMDYMDYPNNQQGLTALNNPTAYLASLPRDPFAGGPSKIYYYRHHPGGGYNYIIVSAGPDGDIDFLDYLAQVSQLTPTASQGRSESDPTLIDALFSKYLTTKTYDPTNGLNSDGDVICLSYK